MKKIAAMSTIPKNEEFKITDRAQKLMNEVGSALSLDKIQQRG